MRKTFVCLLVLVSAAPMYARRLRRLTPDPAPVTIEVTEVSHDPAVARNLIAQVQHSRIERDHERVLAIINNSSARAVLIPAAGSVRGGGNTFFRSDVTMVNYNDTDQNVAVIWMPQGGTASTYKTTFPGGRPPFTQQDFIGTLLKTSGLGALLFIPITSTGAVDTDGAIDVFSRIWTPQPNSTGTVSQPFPGVDPDHIDDFEAIMLGLRQDASYRTNVGIVNMSPDKTFHFTITIFPEVAAPGTQLTEMHVTLLPLSMVQQAVPGSYTTPINILVEVDDDVDIKDLHWSAYASSTDNITGDGWVSIAAHDWDDDTLDSAAVRTRRGR
jgi:hypothetical protein